MIVGQLLWIGAGLLMFVFWLSAMGSWLGFVGVILSFVLAPGLVIFPLVFWIVEGVFPTFYFTVWLVGTVGLVISSVAGAQD